MKSFSHQFLEVLDGTNVTHQQKLIIKKRYLKVVSGAESQYQMISFAYLICNNMTTVCGVLISAFVSFDRVNTPSNATSSEVAISSAFLWIVWGLGILLALTNGFMNTFNINKKYVLNSAVLEKLYSEGWSFVSGIGKYSRFIDTETRFKTFCERIEKIKLKAIGTLQDDGTRSEMDDILSTGFDESGEKGKISSQTTSRRSKNLIFRNKVDAIATSILELSQHFEPEDNIATESSENGNQKPPEEVLVSGGLSLAMAAVDAADIIVDM